MFHARPARHLYETHDDCDLHASQQVHSHSTAHCHKSLLDDRCVAEGTVTTPCPGFVQELQGGEENYDHMSVDIVGSCVLYHRHCGSY